jgi:hypothetical protein
MVIDLKVMGDVSRRLKNHGHDLLYLINLGRAIDMEDDGLFRGVYLPSRKDALTDNIIPTLTVGEMKVEMYSIHQYTKCLLMGMCDIKGLLPMTIPQNCIIMVDKRMEQVFKSWEDKTFNKEFVNEFIWKLYEG